MESASGKSESHVGYIYRGKSAQKYSCGSGSGRISIILEDPDPEACAAADQLFPIDKSINRTANNLKLVLQAEKLSPIDKSISRIANT
jgi:hypothetical protein